MYIHVYLVSIFMTALSFRFIVRVGLVFRLKLEVLMGWAEEHFPIHHPSASVHIKPQGKYVVQVGPEKQLT